MKNATEISAMKNATVYLVVRMNMAEVPKVVGAYWSKEEAERVASEPTEWRNVIPLEVK